MKLKNLLPWITFAYDEESKIFMIRCILLFSTGLFIQLKEDPKYLTPVFFQNTLLLALVLYLGKLLYSLNQ
jgi:hypothetical protein